MEKSKRKRILKSWDLNVKLRAIDEIKRGTDPTVVAKELSVHVKTVRRWLGKEETLKKWKDDHKDMSLAGKKRIKLPMHPMVDHATWMWFKEHRAAGFPITGPIVKIQALNIWKLCGDTMEFQASAGWLEKWKNRHGIKQVTLCGEKLSADEVGADAYKVKFATIIREEALMPQQIFNCDETGLNFRQVPRRSLNSTTAAAAAGFKVQKERLTVMACCNASGTLKLPLMVIGKYAKPRALKNLTTLPVYYKNQKSAWMSAFLFEEWFTKQFVPEVEKYLKSQGLPPKAVLFMDNCAAHPANLAVNQIRVEFLPPNTTPLIQPMDQGCLQNSKTLYKVRLMAFTMDQFNNGASIPQALKNVTIREVIFWLHEAWSEVAPITISKTWKKLWPDISEIVASVCPSETDTNVSNNQEHHLINEFHQHLQSHEDYAGVQLANVNDWVHSSLLLMEDECLSHEEIVQVVHEENSGRPEEQSEQEGKENEVTDAKKLSEAQEHLKQVIEYCEKVPHYTKGHLLGLYQVKEAMASQLLMPNPQGSSSTLK